MGGWEALSGRQIHDQVHEYIWAELKCYFLSGTSHKRKREATVVHTCNKRLKTDEYSENRLHLQQGDNRKQDSRISAQVWVWIIKSKLQD